MVSVKMLMTALEGHIIRTNISRDIIFESPSVMLLDEDAPDFGAERDCIFAADAAAAQRTLEENRLSESAVLFISGDILPADIEPGAWNVKICTTDLEFARLHNTLCHAIELYRRRQQQLDKNVSSKNAFNILYNGGALAGASMFFLTVQKQIISGSTRAEHFELLKSVIDYSNSTISEELSGLLYASGCRFGSCECISIENGLRLCITPVGEGEQLHGYLLAASFGDLSDFRQLTIQTAISLSAVLSKNGAAGESRLPFQELAEKIFLPKEAPTNPEELQMQFQRLPNIPQKYMRGILIRPGAGYISGIEKLAKICADIFSDGNVAVLDEQIYVLISSPYSTCRLQCDETRFSAFLEEYDARAIIGNPAKTTKTLRAMYLQCKALFEVIPKVKFQDELRYVYFERFSQYYIIDLCARYLQQELGTDDIVYLCNPGVLAVTRYDRTNQSDLRDVMFAYLMNKCSISKTAEAMYMHRNTVIYKINKIEEILGQTIDDPYLRHSLIFSCMLIRYRENYQGKSIPLDVFEKTTPQ